MTVKKNIKPTSLEQYLQDYPFSEKSHLRQRKDGRVYVPEAYCQHGHSLMSPKTLFDGLPGVNVVARSQRKEALLCVSPFINDQRKEGPDFREGEQLELLCPTCKAPLESLVPCTCRPGARRRALYLTADMKKLDAVGVCDIYGCPQSFVTDDGELVFMIEQPKK